MSSRRPISTWPPAGATAPATAARCPGRASSASLAAHWLGRFTTASQAAGHAERQAPLQAVLNGIDAMDRAIPAPRHFEGPTNGESAPILGLSKAAANKSSIRARGRLRDLLERVPGCFDEG
jgi:RNA polymerase sigma-70 factor (ECF subfamily)